MTFFCFISSQYFEIFHNEMLLDSTATNRALTIAVLLCHMVVRATNQWPWIQGKLETVVSRARGSSLICVLTCSQHKQQVAGKRINEHFHFLCILWKIMRDGRRTPQCDVKINSSILLIFRRRQFKELLLTLVDKALVSWHHLEFV